MRSQPLQSRPKMTRCPVCAGRGMERITSRDSGPWFEVLSEDGQVQLVGYACQAHTNEFGPTPFRWPDDDRGMRLLYPTVDDL